MDADVKRVREEMLEAAGAMTPQSAEEFRIRFLGKKGAITQLFKLMGNAPPEERPRYGKVLNELRNEAEELLKTSQNGSKKAPAASKIDLTLPGRKTFKGGRHPLTLTADAICGYFQRLGFEIADGPEIDTDYYCFEALNIPKMHPARDMQDTLYISEEIVLRPHTSPVQIRTMEKGAPPFRIIAPGRVYRRDTPDASHSPFFHQIEGLCVDKKTSMADLKAVMSGFSQALFGSKMGVRFRPSYFPFTEPSAEMDIWWGDEKSGRWLEILGCGMVNPRVLEGVNVDPAPSTAVMLLESELTGLPCSSMVSMISECFLRMTCAFCDNSRSSKCTYPESNKDFRKQVAIKMKLLYSWLKDYVDISANPQELAEILSMLGFEVEDVSILSLDYPGLVVGKVLGKEKHPNADKLSLCKVDIGDAANPLQIVCGATNVAAGQFVPVATVGTVLPLDFKIRKSKIRGEVSHGMICSQNELGIGSDADGIWVLPGNLTPGEKLSKALNFQSDAILDVFITPNRPDVMSVIGLAREIAAYENKSMHLPKPAISEQGGKTGAAIKVTIDCPDECPRYSARLIRNIKITESPGWLKERLEACGVRPINNVVDVTNYVLLETGHPLHAFDYDLLAGREIRVRLSVTGEKFTTLDQKERDLQAGTVLICDAEKTVALGGIMGGLNSEVSDKTTNVLLESAYFAPNSIRQGNKSLGIQSEAAQRFSRGADPNGAIYAQNRAAALMAELCGGEIAPGIVDVYPKEIKPGRLTLDVTRVNRLLGTSLTAEAMEDLLGKIGIYEEDSKLSLPTFRPDLVGTADIAEEVGRLFGYNNIPDATISELPYSVHAHSMADFVQELHQHLTGMGLQEVKTNSMVNGKAWHRMTGERLFPILNPISLDMDAMRNSLIPSLLGVLLWNRNRQEPDLAIYEIGRTFHDSAGLKKLPKETRRLAIALCGERHGTSWHSGSQPVDYYDIKGVIEQLSAKILLDNLSFIPYDNFAVGEGQSVQILSGERLIGFLGKVDHQLAKRSDLDFPSFVAELDLEMMFRARNQNPTIDDIPRFPSVERDLALIVDRDVVAADIESVMSAHGGQYLVKSIVFDVYQGKQVAEGKQSIAFRLLFQSLERTLTESEVAQAIDKVLAALKKEFGAELRS